MTTNIQPVVDAMVTWRTLGPSLRTLMHEHVMRALASTDREQERTTRVTPVARASAQAADVAMHYRRMLRDYHAAWAVARRARRHFVGSAG